MMEPAYVQPAVGGANVVTGFAVMDTASQEQVRTNLVGLRTGPPDGEYLVSLTVKRGFITSVAPGAVSSALPLATISETQPPSAAARPQQDLCITVKGRQWQAYERRDGYKYCLLCRAWANREHCRSSRHLWRQDHPEDYLGDDGFYMDAA